LNQRSTSAPDDTPRPPEPTKLDRNRLLQLGAVIALALTAGIIAWAVAGRGGSSSDASRVVPVEPVALSTSGLRTLAGVVGQPIYWAGPQPNFLYELRRTPDAKVYIRYLPPSVAAGASGDYLTVGTFPHRGAFAALEHMARGHGIRLPGGGLALVDAKTPKSVHIAFPNVGYDVEVSDSSPARALAVATSGEVRPA
jgi:hypothetical protein